MEEQDKINIEELMMLHSSCTVSICPFAELVLPQLGQVSIDKYIMNNGFMSVSIINYGSTITSIMLPDKDGIKSDIVLGYDDIYGYLSKENPYFGATIGRVANRISDASYECDNTQYFLSKNCGENMLHGGVTGFDKKVWSAEIMNCNAVEMRYTSPDLEEGFPGKLDTKVRYVLTDNNYLIIMFNAVTDECTPVNLTNHSYFNLAGHETGASGLYEHDLKIYSDTYTELDPKCLIPTGKQLSVQGTPYDFRTLTNVGGAIDKTNCEGVDINYCIKGEGLRTVAWMKHEFSGRSMKVYSNQPGVQLYTANYVNGIEGKDGVKYKKHGSLCLETQNYPNAVNIKTFPPPWLYPREVYEHIVVYKFHVDVPSTSDAFEPEPAEVAPNITIPQEAAENTTDTEEKSET